MALLGLSERERMTEYNCIELLPELEEDVFCVDVIIPPIDESFVSGLDDWWANFVADMCL
ncbi:MAG: hypothetical protein LBB28_06620 [Synergistaceae bacterium]|jgi:uncharacterized radical SAM superfamily protein|nr:hypothetical protein [Synergistaceae bacterium]